MTDTIRCVIPGRTRSVRTRNLAVSGFRVCAAGAAHPGMTHESLFDAATARTEIAR
ncbi:hypothetical protein [Rhodopseudomonas faecalis]|uniref:hypothetical protein n=1 Tax=Rhodopseudomonas faecalis TaxID=99655 RepID=UPI001AED0121|nr:hypothetical protein [Rhodopseudomonas faecalis]